MGRFASTTEFYSRYREPYPPQFFAEAAEKLGLHGQESLLDIGCGPGLLAIGFAPYVGNCTGIDPEPGMIAAAKAAAAEAGVSLSLIHGHVERFTGERSFDIVTIGRALHWLNRDQALAVLERIVSPSGKILICGARSIESETPWAKVYDDTRRSWSADPNHNRYRLDGKTWFLGTGFSEAGVIEATERRRVTIPDLIGRALSKSNTSPEVIGERRLAFEAQIRAVLEPFAQNGMLEEQIIARAAIFARLCK